MGESVSGTQRCKHAVCLNFKLSTWINGKIKSQVRGFKIGLALDLGSHVLMFASQDLNFHASLVFAEHCLVLNKC
jgi:hypothetical protein